MGYFISYFLTSDKKNLFCTDKNIKGFKNMKCKYSIIALRNSKNGIILGTFALWEGGLLFPNANVRQKIIIYVKTKNAPSRA